MKRSGRKSRQVHSHPLHPLFLGQFSRTCLLVRNFLRKICNVKLKSSRTLASRYQVFQITEVAVQLFQPGFDSVLFFVQFFQLFPVGCLGLAWRQVPLSDPVRQSLHDPKGSQGDSTGV